jgi:hypothetical protein
MCRIFEPCIGLYGERPRERERERDADMLKYVEYSGQIKVIYLEVPNILDKQRRMY